MTLYKIGYKTIEGLLQREVCDEYELQIAKNNIERDRAKLLWVKEVTEMDFETIIKKCDTETLKAIMDNCINRLYKLAVAGLKESLDVELVLPKKYRDVIEKTIKEADNSSLRAYTEYCVSEMHYRSMGNWDRDYHCL